MNNLIDGTITDFDEGDLVNGTVVKIEHDEVLVDIGFKSEGVIPVRELSIRKDANPADIVALGDPIEALVLQKEDKDGRLVLSKKRAEYERAWNRIEEKFNSGENVEGEVIEVVKGGLILDIGLRGFLPASLVDLRRVKDLTSYMGTRIEARVIEMDRNRNNVVLSRRVVLEESRKAERSEILSKLKSGMRLQGTVSSIVDFGAFVDLGGIDGLIHISDLSWTKKIKHPAEITQIGADIDVVVLGIDKENRRLSLGHKQLEENPWNEFESKFPIDSVHEGTITEMTDRGAVVSLGDNIEGFAPSRQLAKEDGSTAKVGETLPFKVTEFSKMTRHITLSHTRTFEDARRAEEKAAKDEKRASADATKANVKKINASVEKTTLGDITGLAELKARLEEAESDKKAE